MISNEMIPSKTLNPGRQSSPKGGWEKERKMHLRKVTHACA